MKPNLLRLTGASLLACALSCAGPPSGSPDQAPTALDLEQAPDPVDAPFTTRTAALTAPTCNPATSCTNCNIDLDVNHIVFVHGYNSDKGAFSQFYADFIGQNTCAGYKTYRVSIGQQAETIANHTCSNPRAKPPTYPCEYGPREVACTPDAYDAVCIGQCNSFHADGHCAGYDRTKNGLCGSNGRCVDYSSEGAKKSLSVWADDLASFFWNNKLTDLPDRSVVIVTHSTGGPAVASFMTRGYDGEGALAIPARKVKKVINIQAALGGACGVSLLGGIDDATTDLNRLQDDELNFDFRKATFDGATPWSHFQSKGEVGLTGNECEGTGWGFITTGDHCGGTSHDGVVNNWGDSTSVRHPNGAGNSAGKYAYNITVGAVETKFCHVDDNHPNYRKDFGRFRARLGIPAVPVDAVRNPFMFQPWFPVVLRYGS